jgi:glycosyltransferase involved in cell wall biosynthesis
VEPLKLFLNLTDMNILYFHQYFTTPAGSTATRSYEMAKYLVSQGHNVTMVYAKDARSSSSLSGPYKSGKRTGNYEGIDLIEFDLSYSNRMNLVQRAWIFLMFAFKSTRLVFTLEFDLLFATSTPLTAGIPGIVMKIFRPSKKFVFEVRDLWPELPKAMGVVTNPIVLKLMDWLEYYSYNKADACIGLSPGINQGIERRLKRTKPVALIPNGCDLDIFYPGSEKKSIIPGVNENQFVAMFTGAHGLANGLDAVLDAAAKLIELGEGDSIRLVFIGDGSQKDRLLERKSKERLSNCIFLDPVPKTKLISFLHAADLGLMILDNVPAFYYGTSPNKFFDYIATGLPVLTNYPGWLADMINEHDCGVAVEPNNPDLFAHQLISISKNKVKLSAMSINGRKLAEAKFDRLSLAESLDLHLRSLYIPS